MIASLLTAVQRGGFVSGERWPTDGWKIERGIAMLGDASFNYLMVQMMLLTGVGGLVGDLLLRIVNIVCYRVGGHDGVIVVSRAGCQCDGSKDSGDDKLDLIHAIIYFYDALFNHDLLIINNV